MLSRIILRDPQQGCWYEYSQPLAVLHAARLDDVLPVLANIEARVEEESLYAAGFVTYEAAAGFDSHLTTHPPGSLPLLCFGLFDQRTRLETLPEQAESRLGSWQDEVAPQDYQQRIEWLRGHIAAGDTYQVNYTTRLHAEGRINLGTFARMAKDAPYGAYIEGDDFTVVSASPELFFERQGGVITSKPMKGTASRGLSSCADMQQAQWLRQSDKNRAENLMITDMVRNDLGRVADVGSVQVSELFGIECYPTVWQMTSTVTARSEASVVDLFTTLFPGASITGAPKYASMQFIRQSEVSPREIYTGTIGLIAPGQYALFNIAIRTAWSDKLSNTSRYGAGGGIVWDSDGADEFAELQVKTRVLHAERRLFELLETMRWTPEQGIYLRQRHMQRLADSALYFAYLYEPQEIEHALQVHLDSLPPRPHRVRLCLKENGAVHVESEELVLSDQVQILALAAHPVCADDVSLYHKTTDRKVYQQATATVPAGQEALLYNTRGFVTESAIANIVYRMAGKLYTPPVSDGLLPGTLRGQLLAEGEVQERSLHLDQLDEVESWYLVNALRGWRTAEFRR